MIVASTAINKQYEIEVERLKRSIGVPVDVFTMSSSQYKERSTDPILDGLYHKSNFANYLKGEKDESVLFCDADLFSLKKNPLKTFKPKKNTDVAYVPYKGRFHFPDKARQEAFDYHGYKINSGFMYFRTLELAQEICREWSEIYLKRHQLYEAKTQGVTKYEYDEYALMIALMNKPYNIEHLDSKWNDWELSSKDEILNSESIFFQSHKHLDII